MSDSPEKPSFKAPPTPVSGSGPSGVVDQHHDIFFAAVETTRMPMIVTDPHQPDNPLIFANDAFLREIRQAIAERREYASEILNLRKDRSTFWNALFVSRCRREADAGEVALARR